MFILLQLVFFCVLARLVLTILLESRWGHTQLVRYPLQSLVGGSELYDRRLCSRIFTGADTSIVGSCAQCLESALISQAATDSCLPLRCVFRLPGYMCLDDLREVELPRRHALAHFWIVYAASSEA